MIISKTDFMKIMKYDLDGIDEVLEKNKMVVDENIDNLINLEIKEKLKEFSASIPGNEEDDDEEELILDEKLEMMLPYYSQFEEEVGKITRNRFGGKVLYSKETYKQKKFNLVKDSLNLYCFVDVYQEDDDTIRIFETKATTSSRFSKDKDRFYFASNNESRRKTRNDFFVLNEDGTYLPFEMTGKPFPDGSDYKSRKEKIMDIFDDRGRYLYDLAFQRYIISRSLDTTKRVEYYLVVLNHDYVYDGEVDKDGKPIYKEDLVRLYNMTNIVEEMDEHIENDLKFIMDNAFNPDFKKEVIKKYRNSGKTNQTFLKNLFKEETSNGKSIFNYIGRHYGFTDGDTKINLNDVLFEKKWFNALDIPESFMNRENNLIQRQSIVDNEPIFNKDKIKEGLKLIKYPIYHLDFETFNSPLPRFKGEKPYTQSLFQFSVHVQKEKGILDFEKDNVSYLVKDHEDHREELLLKLLETIPQGPGSVLVYNASFERGRLEELQDLFPEHKDHLQNIIDRLFDLLHIVRGNEQLYRELGFELYEAKTYNYYHPDLNGSFSLKNVLPVFSDLTYEGLDVYDGTQAMITYANFPFMTEEVFKEKYDNLLYYCKQDTYAMYEVLNEISKLVNK